MKATWIRIVAIDPTRENDSNIGTYCDLTVNSFDEISAAYVGTKIIDMINDGVAPIDVWDNVIKLVIIEGVIPTLDFYQMVIDQVKDFPLEV